MNKEKTNENTNANFQFAKMKGCKTGATNTPN